MNEPFFIEDDRYARLRLIPWWDQDRIAAATVLVAGVGALGNEICKNLALLGVGTVVLVDNDVVEVSNLSRAVLFRAADAGRPKVEAAALRMTELNGAVRAVPLDADVTVGVGLGWFLDADVILGALDNRESRLWLNRLARRTRTPWIDGGIQEIGGQVRVFHPEGACYECGMTAQDYANLNLRYSCPGLKRSDIEEGKIPTTPTVSSIVAGLEVQEALKWLHGRGPDRSLALMYQGATNHFYVSALTERDGCLAHDPWPDPEPLALDPAVADADDVFAAVEARLPGAATLELDRDVLVALACPACGAQEEILTPLAASADSLLPCPACGGERRTETAYRIARGSALAARPLKALGVPPRQVLHVLAPGDEGFFLLGGAV